MTHPQMTNKSGKNITLPFSINYHVKAEIRAEIFSHGIPPHPRNFDEKEYRRKTRQCGRYEGAKLMNHHEKWVYMVNSWGIQPARDLGYTYYIYIYMLTPLRFLHVLTPVDFSPEIIARSLSLYFHLQTRF